MHFLYLDIDELKFLMMILKMVKSMLNQKEQRERVDVITLKIIKELPRATFAPGSTTTVGGDDE
jgi:hypothetical protein